MPLPEGLPAVSRYTIGTPSEVRLARNTQPCARANSSVSKRCQADQIQRAGQPHLLSATGPAQEPECWHSFLGWGDWADDKWPKQTSNPQALSCFFVQKSVLWDKKTNEHKFLIWRYLSSKKLVQMLCERTTTTGRIRRTRIITQKIK